MRFYVSAASVSFGAVNSRESGPNTESGRTATDCHGVTVARRPVRDSRIRHEHLNTAMRFSLWLPTEKHIDSFARMPVREPTLA